MVAAIYAEPKRKVRAPALSGIFRVANSDTLSIKCQEKDPEPFSPIFFAFYFF